MFPCEYLTTNAVLEYHINMYTPYTPEIKNKTFDNTSKQLGIPAIVRLSAKLWYLVFC